MYAGTINTMLIIDRPLTPAALARVVVTMTEGKSAALHRLAVPSKLHVDLATGTGTDQYCVAAPSSGARPLTSASPHMKLGELVGLATRNATLEALRWQNGLEASYTRGLFHALGRYGVKEATLFDEIAPLMTESDLELLKKNSKAAFYEPLVGAAAHALATVCDRVRYGTIPEAVAADAMVQQARRWRRTWRRRSSLARVPHHATPSRERRGEGSGAQSTRARVVRKWRTVFQLWHRWRPMPRCSGRRPSPTGGRRPVTRGLPSASSHAAA